MKFILGTAAGFLFSLWAMNMPETRQFLTDWLISGKHLTPLIVDTDKKNPPPKDAKETPEASAENQVNLPRLVEIVTDIQSVRETESTRSSSPSPEFSQITDFQITELKDKTIASEIAEPPGAADESLPLQIVWSAFRSETSANGFAAMLQSQLSSPFTVIKSAPGHYEVGFYYKSEKVRAERLAAIEAITSYKFASEVGA